jgi:hypothetical protein
MTKTEYYKLIELIDKYADASVSYGECKGDAEAVEMNDAAEHVFDMLFELMLFELKSEKELNEEETFIKTENSDEEMGGAKEKDTP